MFFVVCRLSRRVFIALHRRGLEQSPDKFFYGKFTDKRVVFPQGVLGYRAQPLVHYCYINYFQLCYWRVLDLSLIKNSRVRPSTRTKVIAGLFVLLEFRIGELPQTFPDNLHDFPL